ncbi:hypothetical protein CCR85_09905 [Rhodothalassium salexigens]|nr:hypothetical protein [Rhodothalassium salexigens]
MEPVMTDPTPAGVLDRMRALSSAEDMFALLDLAYDEAVLNRARLHVMKRLGDYLDRLPLDQLDEDGAFREARAALQRAHDDFVTASPRQQKALKVFTQARGNMLPLEGLRPIAR